MSRMLSVLALAGDKAAARTAAVAEVSAAVLGAVLHNDRSIITDTLRDLPKGPKALAIGTMLTAVDDLCVLIRMGSAIPAPNDGWPSFVAGIYSAASEAATLHTDALRAAMAAEPKARKGHAEPLGAFAAAMGEAFGKAHDAREESATAERKAKAAERKAATEAKAAEAKAAEDTRALRADGEGIVVNVAALLAECDALRIALADAEARAVHAEARAAAAVLAEGERKAERDAARVDCAAAEEARDAALRAEARALATVATLQAAKAAKGRKSVAAA